jgi:peroxiredoxin
MYNSEFLRKTILCLVLGGTHLASVLYAQETPKETPKTDTSKPNVTIEMAMGLQPVQKAVDIDFLTPEEMKQSTIMPYKDGKVIGYVVKNSQGNTVRMFIDTDDTKGIDQWSYYKDGLETYRDIDSNGNKKADQYRWFHTAGSRWGIDVNEDGVIDYWKTISPEEVSQEVIASIADGDPERFLRVALSQEDLRKLQCGEELNRALSQKIASLREEFQAAVTLLQLSPETQWIQFGGNRPSAIPAGRDGNAQDLQVYQNTIVLVQDSNSDKQVLIGSMVKVGDVWKVVDAPHPDSQEYVYSSPFFPAETGGESLTELNTISQEIETLNQQISTTEKDKRGAVYDQVVNKMIDAANKCKDPKERDQWLINLADTMSTAVYQKDYPNGLTNMKTIEEKLKGSHVQLAAYFRYKRIVAAYYTAQMEGTESPESIQDTWIKNLEQLLTDYPNTASTAEAMLQLGLYYEEIAKPTEAKEIYTKVTSHFSGSPYAAKASGAVKRLEAVGNELAFSGKSVSGTTIDIAQYKGNIVLLYFWASWADPYGDEISSLKFLQERNARDGLKIVGVNLDDSADVMNKYLTDHAVNWPQIHESGGVNSRPANMLGVQHPPFYILIDSSGKVAAFSSVVSDLDRAVFNLLKKSE